MKRRLSAANSAYAEGNIRKLSVEFQHSGGSEQKNSRGISSRVRLARRCESDYHTSCVTARSIIDKKRSMVVAAFPARCRGRTCSASLNYSAKGEENVLIVPRNKRTHVRVRVSRDSHVLHTRHSREYARVTHGCLPCVCDVCVPFNM